MNNHKFVPSRSTFKNAPLICEDRRPLSKASKKAQWASMEPSKKLHSWSVIYDISTKHAIWSNIVFYGLAEMFPMEQPPFGESIVFFQKNIYFGGSLSKSKIPGQP